MIGIGPMPAGGSTAGRAARSRLTERHVLALGLLVSGILVGAAAGTAGAVVLTGGSPWAAIHLALAGAATVAIGTFMPHFAVTLAGTRPRAAAERVAAIGLLSGGAVAVVAGVTIVGGWLAAIGSVLTLAGLAIVALETLDPLRDPLARRHHVVTVTYGAALLMLAATVVLGGLGALGIEPVLGAWARLRPAHAWLGLFGAVSLTIFATLVYLAPTVLGARIRASAWLFAGAGGMLAGPMITATGFGLDARPVVVVGLLVLLAGSVGQLGYLVDVVRRRGPFTSEHDWRRVSWVHLVAGAGWFAAAIAAAIGSILLGAPIRGWSIGLLAIPAVAGWMLQELIGSWTYLVPSVTPGDAKDHARQRRLLAGASWRRLVALNVGVALAWGGAWTGIVALAATGAALVGGTVVASLVMLARGLTAARY